MSMSRCCYCIYYKHQTRCYNYTVLYATHHWGRRGEATWDLSVPLCDFLHLYLLQDIKFKNAMRYTCLFQLWFPQGICPVGQLLGRFVVLFLVFKGISMLFSIVAGSVYIPTNRARGFPSHHTLSSIYCLQIWVGGGEEVQEGRDIWVLVADSSACEAEANTIL